MNEQQDNYIDINDGNPTSDGAYLCYLANNKIIKHQAKMYSVEAGWNDSYVTHWQELPCEPVKRLFKEL